MKLTLGFSPCPNDTFIFDALVNNKINNEGLEFEPVLEDVETLNRWAYEEKLDITKLSFPALFQNINKYSLLNSGAALGKGVGPILITKLDTDKPEVEKKTIALPGKNTTANLLFTFAFPEAAKKRFMIFSAIENAVLNQETDLGVIIHENRFTYQEHGLKKVVDLGAYWEEKMNLPIPLGGIAIKKSVDKMIGSKVENLIRKSIEVSFSNYPLVTEYIKRHSQEMSEYVMRQHIELYVNNYSLDLGNDGKEAIRTLHKVFLTQQKQDSPLPGEIFLS